jgi:hypothetical protein
MPQGRDSPSRVDETSVRELASCASSNALRGEQELKLLRIPFVRLVARHTLSCLRQALTCLERSHCTGICHESGHVPPEETGTD